MSSNRIRILLTSLLAVFAISAVASASASAGCYKVAPPGAKTGNYEDNKCTVKVAAKEYIKATLVRHVAGESGVWCAKVEEAGTGNKDESCETNVGTTKNEYIKVMESWDEYEVCQEGGTEKYTEHLCSTKSGTGKWSWLPIPAGKKFAVTSTGGAFELTGGGSSSDCTAVTNTGEIGPGGESTNVTLKFTGCTNDSKKCEAFAPAANDGTGEIVVSGITDQLVQRETSLGVKVLADEFKENATTKEFVTIEFEVPGTEECKETPTTKVKKQVAGQCTNITVAGQGETELIFPKPELLGNTLEAFGVKASLFGTATVSLVNKWSYRCV